MSSNSDQQIIERVKILRDKFAGPRGKSKFAKAIGISPSTYNYYEKDRVPPIETLVKMAELSGADLVWLLTGKKNTEKLQLGPNQGLIKKIIRLLDENQELAGPLEAFVELLEAQQEIENKGKSKKVKDDKGGDNWIPVLGRTAAGIAYKWNETLKQQRPDVTELKDIVKEHTGKDILDSREKKIEIDLKARPLMENLSEGEVSIVRVTENNGDELFEFVDSEKIISMFSDAFALHIDGDSMSPKINDGNIVIVSPSVNAIEGQTAVVKIKDQIGVTCKLFRKDGGKVHLIPVNEKFDTKVFDENELEWALAVLCHVDF